LSKSCSQKWGKVAQKLPKIEKVAPKIQNVFAIKNSFVINRYSTEKDVVKLGWLPTLERAQFNLLKSVYKSMYNPL
jgi:hypothetical protein